MHRAAGLGSEFPMTLPRTLVFDLDGTLVDSVPDLTNALNKMLRERGHAPLSRSEVVPMGHGRARAMHVAKL